MATLTTGKSWSSGETVTPSLLNQMVNSATIAYSTADDTDNSTLEISGGKFRVKDAGITAAKLAAGTALPTGAVMPFAMNAAPTGWLACDGAEYSKTGTYADLFAAIGTSFGETNGSGGTGASHFRVPDMRGIFVRGSGSQTISGTTYSGTFAARQQDAFKAHTHGMANDTTNTSPANSSGPLNLGGVFNVDNGKGSGLGAFVTQSESVGGTETRPANIALLYCIKH